eukprot:m.28036 g.28036  ORF g.28036 m.28036 type:complete len:113 (+) comp11806_c0_seq3:61-399(+)
MKLYCIICIVLTSAKVTLAEAAHSIEPALALDLTTPHSIIPTLMAVNDHAIALCKHVESSDEFLSNMILQTVSFNSSRNCAGKQLETVTNIGCKELKGHGTAFARHWLRHPR